MTTQTIHCDCGAVEITTSGDPRVHAFCHCEDCRELLQVPYHSVLAWNGDKVKITKGKSETVEFKHPSKNMTKVFCRCCGEVLYNTNAMGWKIVSQLLYTKSTGHELPESHLSNAHFFYDRRVVNVEDELPKRGV